MVFSIAVLAKGGKHLKDRWFSGLLPEGELADW
jgi:hypothetical protein